MFSLRKWTALFLSSFALIGVAPVQAQEFDHYAGSELIRSFKVDVTLDSDQTATIVETIQYDFGQYDRHGIYRDIPQVYSRNGAKYHLLFKGITVLQDGQSATYVRSTQGDALRLKIGDADKTLTGSHTYQISYQTQRSLNTFPAKQEREWYWNITGNGWNIPILDAELTLKAPTGTKEAACFTGIYGSRESDCKITNQGERTQVTLTKPLDSYEGLTVVLSYPQNAFNEIPLQTTLLFLFIDNLWVGVPIIVFLLMWLIWFMKGRDPRGTGVIIPEYEEPEKLGILEMSAILDSSISSKAITASFIDLARRGYMYLDYQGASDKRMTLVKLKEPDGNLTNAEQLLLRALFKGKNAVITSSRIDGLDSAVILAKDSVMSELKKQGYFPHRPGAVRAFWYVMAIVVPIALITLFTDRFGELMIFGGIISGIIMAVFAHFMPKVTYQGALVREKILGFKKFLSVTEEKRLAFTDAPEKKPEQFARFLPAAVAFGVENQWAKQFANMTLPAPSYIHNYPSFSSRGFVKSVHAMESKLASSYTPPSSAGSGSSGFSGGGSGGGFGGGGGGSW